MADSRTILVGIDFTPPSMHALREAVRRASLDGARVIAVHVVPETLAFELKKALATDDAGVLKDCEAHLQRFIDDTEAGSHVVETFVTAGHPFAGLCEACHQHRADLLVLGAEGSKRAGAHRIGAVAAKCVRSAPADVLVVRGETRIPFKHVIACVDFSENSAKAVKHAARLAELDEADLDCLHIRRPGLGSATHDESPESSYQQDDPEAESCLHRLKQFVAPLTRSFRGGKVTARVDKHMNIRDAILDHAEDRRTDLVVLGTRGRTGLRHLLIGTTAERIIQHAPCSILAVKPMESPAVAARS